MFVQGRVKLGREGFSRLLFDLSESHPHCGQRESTHHTRNAWGAWVECVPTLQCSVGMVKSSSVSSDSPFPDWILPIMMNCAQIWDFRPSPPCATVWIPPHQFSFSNFSRIFSSRRDSISFPPICLCSHSFPGFHDLRTQLSKHCLVVNLIHQCPWAWLMILSCQPLTFHASRPHSSGYCFSVSFVGF